LTKKKKENKIELVGNLFIKSAVKPFIRRQADQGRRTGLLNRPQPVIQQLWDEKVRIPALAKPSPKAC
jgi:hypothetical protein